MINSPGVLIGLSPFKMDGVFFPSAILVFFSSIDYQILTLSIWYIYLVCDYSPLTHAHCQLSRCQAVNTPFFANSQSPPSRDPYHYGEISRQVLACIIDICLIQPELAV